MKVSPEGRVFIEHEEGLRLEAYPDSAPDDPPERVPIWTIGTGHTGPEVHKGLVWTREQCGAALTSDLARVEAAINRLCRIPPRPNQFDAMASLAFNIGLAPSRFPGSTVLRLYNANDLQGAADAFRMWKKPPRLIPRRERERALFLRS